MKTSAPPTIAPAAQLPVTRRVMITVSVVAISLHVNVLVKLRVLLACPVPGICTIVGASYG